MSLETLAGEVAVLTGAAFTAGVAVADEDPEHRDVRRELLEQQARRFVCERLLEILAEAANRVAKEPLTEPDLTALRKALARAE